MTKETVFRVDYHEFEAIVNKEYGLTVKKKRNKDHKPCFI